MILRTTRDPGTPGQHPHTELTATEDRRIFEMAEDGFSTEQIAERYDTELATVRKAILRHAAYLSWEGQ